MSRPIEVDRFAGESGRVDFAMREEGNVRLAFATLAVRDDATELLVFFDCLRTWCLVVGDVGDISSLVRRVLDDPELQVAPLVEGNAANTFDMVSGFSLVAGSSKRFERAFELAIESGDETLHAEIEFQLGADCLWRGDFVGAVRHLATAAALQDGQAHEASLSIFLGWYGLALCMEGRVVEGLACALRGQRLAQDTAVGAFLITPPLSFVAARARDMETAVRAIEATADIQPPSPFTCAAALMIDRIDLALNEAVHRLASSRSLDVRDISMAYLVAVLCTRLGETELAVLWTALTHALQQVRAEAFGAEANDALRYLEACFGVAEQLAPITADARTLLGDRFDELVDRYRRDPWGPHAETIAVLSSHLATIREAQH